MSSIQKLHLEDSLEDTPQVINLKGKSYIIVEIFQVLKHNLDKIDVERFRERRVNVEKILQSVIKQLPKSP
jgi:hypothetical protein